MRFYVYESSSAFDTMHTYVLDRAFCHRIVFNVGHYNLPLAERRELARAKAAMLNHKHGATG